MNERALRQEVIERDRVCMDCGGPGEEVHHILPRSRFGKHGKEKLWALKNLVLLCVRCHQLSNGGAGAHTRERRQAHMTLLKECYGYDYNDEPWKSYI